jgi:hypothetical protein
MARRTSTRRPKQTRSTGTRRTPPRRNKVPSAAATATAATTGGTSMIHGSDIPSSSPKEPENHPPDCQCFLKRVNQSLFLPPPAITTPDNSDKA